MKVQKKPNIYKQAHRFADVTKTLIMKGKMVRVKKCLQMAEEMFNKGSYETRNLISNVYLYSVSSFMEMHHCRIKGLLPNALLNEYKHQINASGL